MTSRASAPLTKILVANRGFTILDHIDNIVVPGSVLTEPANEYWALRWLWHGMEFLYCQANRCDDVAKQVVNPNGNVRFWSSGNFPAFQHVPHALLTCSFHWYAISACQYVGTVGAIAHRQDNARPGWRDYVKAVIPEVFAFRNKVAAHFAWCIGDNRDNPAERFASIMPSLTFADDCFQIAGYAVGVRQAGKASDSTAIQPWSLCRVHERLRQRYWPELVSAKGDNGPSGDATKPLASVLSAARQPASDQGDDPTTGPPPLDRGDDPTAHQPASEASLPRRQDSSTT